LRRYPDRLGSGEDALLVNGVWRLYEALFFAEKLEASYLLLIYRIIMDVAYCFVEKKIVLQ
jgi:hypothetical protein